MCSAEILTMKKQKCIIYCKDNEYRIKAFIVMISYATQVYDQCADKWNSYVTIFYSDNYCTFSLM